MCDQLLKFLNFILKNKINFFQTLFHFSSKLRTRKLKMSYPPPGGYGYPQQQPGYPQQQQPGYPQQAPYGYPQQQPPQPQPNLGFDELNNAPPVRRWLIYN